MCHADEANPLLDTLIADGIKSGTAWQLVQKFDAATILHKRRYYYQQKARGKAKDVGFLIDSLLEGWDCKVMDATPEAIAKSAENRRNRVYVPRTALKEGCTAIMPDFEEKRAAAKNLRNLVAQARQGAGGFPDQRFAVGVGAP